MLEERLAELTKETIALRVAVEANTAAHGGKAGATTAAKADKKGTTTTTSKHKPAEIEAMAKRVQKEVSSPVAKKLITDTGAKDLNDLVTNKGDKFDAFMVAAEAALAPDDTTTEPDEDEL